MNRKIVECGCCGCYHWEDYYGDCRNDAERFDYEDLGKMGIDESDIITLEEQVEEV